MLVNLLTSMCYSRDIGHGLVSRKVDGAEARISKKSLICLLQDEKA